MSNYQNFQDDFDSLKNVAIGACVLLAVVIVAIFAFGWV